MRGNSRNGISSLKHIHRKIYISWIDMKHRCYTENRKCYKNYGGRGIIVCDEWLYDFMSFYHWSLLNGWKDGLELDRIDNNGNYEPDNCIFVTTSENCAVGKRRKSSSNTSGFIGVYYNQKLNKYTSSIMINRKSIFLGYHNTIKQAIEARIQAEILYFKEQKTNFHYVK